jgi:hypothetical protein
VLFLKDWPDLKKIPTKKKAPTETEAPKIEDVKRDASEFQGLRKRSVDLEKPKEKPEKPAPKKEPTPPPPIKEEEGIRLVPMHGYFCSASPS